MALDGLKHLVGVELRGLDGGKRKEEACRFATFCKVQCHFLAQRLKSKLTLSMLSPHRGHQPYDTPISASVTHSHGALFVPSSQGHPQKCQEQAEEHELSHNQPRGESVSTCAHCSPQRPTFLYVVILAHFLVKTLGVKASEQKTS